MMVQMHVFSASECRKWHLHSQNFPGEHAPGPPLAGSLAALGRHVQHTPFLLRPLQAIFTKLTLIVAMQSLVLEASNTMAFYIKYVKI